MQVHSVANIFPLMAEPEFQSLKADIAEFGQREPIWTFNDMIIDGRHRFRACDELGIEPMTRLYDGPESGLVAFVVSLNLKRRHMNDNQRSMVAARLANLEHGQRPDRTDAPLAPVTQADAAELLAVDRRSVQRAKTVVDDGAPELVAAVDSGRVSVRAAADVATLPQAEQAEIVARGETEILQAAKDIRQKKAEVRRHGYGDQYPYEFTVRSARDSGARTELAKMIDGFGDWLFYGHANADSSDIDRWWLVDLHAWRAALIRNRGEIVLHRKSNGDGTHFVAFDLRSFPASPPILVAGSHPLPTMRVAA